MSIEAYECTECALKFDSREEFERHMREHHQMHHHTH